jgi:hypothetical protein
VLEAAFLKVYGRMKELQEDSGITHGTSIVSQSESKKKKGNKIEREKKSLST